jgi:hypothetical protein
MPATTPVRKMMASSMDCGMVTVTNRSFVCTNPPFCRIQTTAITATTTAAMSFTFYEDISAAHLHTDGAYATETAGAIG